METFLELLKKLGTVNDMSNTAYDTAWVARLGDMTPDISNRALGWIYDHQLKDGSWGAEFPMYYYDRVICTLSAMISLRYKGTDPTNEVRIQNGLDALTAITSRATKSLQSATGVRTVGFEMIVPTLLAEAESLGIIKHQKDQILSTLVNIREVKMQKLSGLKISRFATIAHSAEMTGRDKMDLLDIENLQEKNGSVGNSPSATAHFALYVKPGEENALEYLSSIIYSRNNGAPTLSPIDIFERVWVLWNLSLTNLFHESREIAEVCNAHLDYLEKNWQLGLGLGFSESFTPTDADDTFVGYEILSKFGRKPELDAVLQYEEEKFFRCYPLEANPSIDVNIHVLSALREAGYEKDHPSIQKALNFIRSMRQSGKYWFDKWNLSPYYTAAHAIIHCQGYDDEMCQASVNWILETQKANGSWGFYATSTAEETAYCLQALATWQKYTSRISPGRIEQGYRWLLDHCEGPYPPLWIGKSLYCPELLVKSSILSALTLIQEQIG